MTINRLWQCGFEANSIYEFDGGSTGLQNSWVKTGTWAIRVEPGHSAENARIFWKDIATTRQIRSGFVVRMEHIGTVTDGEILVVRSGATRLLEIRTVQADNNIQLIVAGSQEDVTTDAPLAIDTWFHFGIDCKVDNTIGWVKVNLNGIEILSFTGNTGNVDIDNIVFGSLTDVGATFEYWYYDDCYIDDTTGEGLASMPPILRFYWIYPDGNGNYDQWVGSDGNNVDNYLLVDERPPNTSDYVEEGTVDQFDSYDMTTFTLGIGQQIDAVIPIIYAQRYGVAEEIALGTRYSSIDVIGSDQDPGFGAWKYLWERQTTKPGGGAWDQTSLDDIEAVVKSRGTF